MDATQEWLRYIENKAIKQKYHISGYTNIPITENGSTSSSNIESDCTSEDTRSNFSSN